MNMFSSVPEALVTLSLSWLFTYLVHSTLLILGALLLAFLPSFRDYHIQDVLWKGALVAGIVTASLQCFGAFEVPVLSQESVTPAAPTAAVSVSTYALPEAPLLSSDFAPGPARIKSGPVDAHVEPAGSEAGGWPIWVLQSLMGLWLIGVVIALAKYLVRCRRLFSDIGQRRPVTSGFPASTLRDLCNRCGLQRKITLTTSAFLKSPVALSGREICIPERALTDLEPVQQEAMLAHELAHIVRRDPFWLKLWAAFDILFFFQPLNRLARRHQQTAAESLCDAWAVSQTGRYRELASCLLQVAVWLKGERPLTAVSGMASSPLSQRIQQLLTGSTMKPTSFHRGHLLLMSVLILSVMFLVPQVTLKAAQPAPPAPPEAPVLQDEPTPPQAELPQAPEAPQPVLTDSLMSPPTPPEPARPESPVLPVEMSVPEPAPVLSPIAPVPVVPARPRYQWEKDGVRYEVEVEGEVTLSDDHRSILRISPDGLFYGRTGSGSIRTTIDVTPESDGTPAYDFRVGGQARPFDDEAKAWLADVLLSWQEIKEKMALLEEKMSLLQLDMEHRQLDMARLQEEMETMNQGIARDMEQNQLALRRSMDDMQESMRHLQQEQLRSVLSAEQQLKKAQELVEDQVQQDLTEKMALSQDKLRRAQEMMLQLERTQMDRESDAFRQAYDAMMRARDMIETNRPDEAELNQLREALRNLEEAIKDLE